MEDVKLLIAGRDAPAAKSATFDRLNPISGEVATRASAATAVDAKAAADAAAAAFPKWAALGPSARRALLNKAADLLEARAAQFAAILSTETGATGGWGHFNVHLAAGMLREAAAMTTQISGEVIPSDVPNKSYVATVRIKPQIINLPTQLGGTGGRFGFGAENTVRTGSQRILQIAVKASF